MVEREVALSWRRKTGGSGVVGMVEMAASFIDLLLHPLDSRRHHCLQDCLCASRGILHVRAPYGQYVLFGPCFLHRQLPESLNRDLQALFLICCHAVTKHCHPYMI